MTTLSCSWHDHDIPTLDDPGIRPDVAAKIRAAISPCNILLVGPPGAAKTMCARRIVTELPPLTDAEAEEVCLIGAAPHRDIDGIAAVRPFRAPHHSISRTGLLGGGRFLHLGEATRAHGGVLYLDELQEFSCVTLDGLREPIESGHVTIYRPGASVVLPARFLLVASVLDDEISLARIEPYLPWFGAVIHV